MSNPSSLTDQALENLVNQFARPLDFLRELVQNSIDAGSPRIEVWVDYTPPTDRHAGVVRIAVDDFGCGMNEAVIDRQLLELYSSTKEGDLTKIGKFGIGFTSIFAIRPDRVWLQTGREGEYWDLLSGPERTWEKVRRTEPVAGTKITLFKHMNPEQVDPFVREARAVLQYWCEHSDVPITFDDRRGAAATGDDSEDPFAAFADAPTADTAVTTIQRPLDLDAEFVERLDEPGTTVLVGLGDAPRYGFYNGGLTLLNTTNDDALGAFRDTLRHVSFKVKNNRLEHTLTRDNVLQDDAWRDAMTRVQAAHQRLLDRIADSAEARAREGAAPTREHRWLARASATDRSFAGRLGRRALLVDVFGAPLTPADIAAQEQQLGAVLVDAAAGALHESLRALGVHVVRDAPATRELLVALAPTRPGFGRRPRPLRPPDEVFCSPAVIDPGALPASERRLFDRTRELLAAAVGVRVHLPLAGEVLRWAPAVDAAVNRLDLRIGDFDGDDDALCLNGPPSGGVFLRPTPRWLRLPAVLRWRTLLLNRRHPLYRTHVLASVDDLELAALALAQALLHEEGAEGDAAARRMLAAMHMEAAGT